MSIAMTRSEKIRSMEEYIATYNPYKSAISIDVDIRKVIEYARKKGKKVSELTEEEVNRFRISSTNS